MSGGAERDQDPTVHDRPKPISRPPDPVLEAATEILPAAPGGSLHGSSRSGAPSRSAPGGGSSVAVSSPLEALYRAEILSTRQFCRIGFGIGLSGPIAIFILPGHPVTSTILIALMACTLGAIIYLYWRTSNPLTFHKGHGVAIAWYIPALSVSACVPYFGPFSPVAVVLVLGIYFTALSSTPRLSLTVFITQTTTQAVTGTLVILDVIDPGFVPVFYMPLIVQIVCQALVQVVLIGTFLIARAHRRSSLTALKELERAVRVVAQRDAVLEEAREELRRAVGTGRGRFTDQMIGRYHLGDVIGRGAMGEVYEAVDTTSNEQVAVKLLAHSSLGDPQHVERFLRELRTASSIDSPNVVRVLEVGEQPLPHLVMERLRGKDLATILRDKRGALSRDRLIDLVRQVGTGITAAAAKGIVHRDLKPQNIFLVGTTWKILDFGIARLQSASDTLTAGHVVGTPAYMAPEQAQGAPVDHRTDLYALAAIAYRALTGHAPFSGGEVMDVLYRVVHSAPRQPSKLANLAEDVDFVLAIGLAKRPPDRFATAVELVEALEAALDRKLDERTRARGRALIEKGAWAPTAPLVPPEQL